MNKAKRKHLERRGGRIGSASEFLGQSPSVGYLDPQYLCAYSMRIKSLPEAAMSSIYDRNAPKKPTNLSINSDLLKKARELDINLSSGVEEALEQLIRRRLNERWISENREAIASYNEHVDANGVFSDGVRGF
jgi:antitoxin CcdA